MEKQPHRNVTLESRAVIVLSWAMAEDRTNSAELVQEYVEVARLTGRVAFLSSGLVVLETAGAPGTDVYVKSKDRLGDLLEKVKEASG